MKAILTGHIVFAFFICAVGARGQELRASGVTEPVSDATLGTSVGGTVSAIVKREGAVVKTGDVIIELDNELESLEVDRRKVVSESKARLDAAQSRVETLRIDLEATRQLFEGSKSISKEDLQKKELEFKQAEAELEGLQMEEKREAIEYKMALAQLDRKLVKAPFDGVVVSVFPEVGENCTPQQPLARVVDISKCCFVAHIEAGQPWNLEQGGEVKLVLAGKNGPVEVRGKVQYVSPVVDPSSGLQEVRVLFENADGAIRPGVNGVMVRGNVK